MRIGVPKEIRPGEARVGLAPDVIGKLVKQGLEVFIESGAGLLSGFPDKQYLDAGVELREDITDADVIVGVKEIPTEFLYPLKTKGFWGLICLTSSLTLFPFNK